MSTPAIVANMARGWNRDPAGVATGTQARGISAALWTHDGDDVQEVWADPDPSMHIVAIAQTSWRAEMHLDGRTERARTIFAGGVQLVRAGSRPRCVNQGRWRALHIYLPVQLIENLVASENLAGSDSIELCDPRFAPDRVIGQIGHQVMAELDARQPLSQLRVDALGQDLAVQMLRRHSTLASSGSSFQESSRGGLASWQERRCTEYLHDNLADDVELTTLAAIANLSPFHFARMFRKTTGVPPHRYQLLLRLERAKALLVETDMSVLEIALAVGYDNPQTLGRLFQRELGVTPSAYRRERKL